MRRPPRTYVGGRARWQDALRAPAFQRLLCGRVMLNGLSVSALRLIQCTQNSSALGVAKYVVVALIGQGNTMWFTRDSEGIDNKCGVRACLWSERGIMALICDVCVSRQLRIGGCFVRWVVVSTMSAVPPEEPTAAVSLDRGYRI
jgi:hypothetical protein